MARQVNVTLQSLDKTVYRLGEQITFEVGFSRSTFAPWEVATIRLCLSTLRQTEWLTENKGIALEIPPTICLTIRLAII